MHCTNRVAVCLSMVAVLACSEGKEEPKEAPAVDINPMAATGYRVEWSKPDVPANLQPGATVAVSITVKNTSDQVWRDIPSSDRGRYAVRLGYRWWSPKDAKVPTIDYTQTRADLNGPLAPGASTTLTIEVVAPPTPGPYVLQLDLVEELFVWFERRGANKMMVPVTVS